MVYPRFFYLLSIILIILPIISSCSPSTSNSDEDIPTPGNLTLVDIGLDGFSVRWSETQFSLRLQVSTSDDFSSTGIDQVFTSNPAEIEQLEINTNYFIRAQYVEGTVSSDFSAVQQISTLELLPPSPVSASMVLGDSFKVSWGPVEQATYELQVATDQAFINPLVSINNKPVTTTSSILQDLAIQTSYFFRVRSVFEEHKSEYVSGTIQTTDELVFKIFSTTFDDGSKIPASLSCSNVSPHLTWRNMPPQTVSIAIVMDDLDFPNMILNHWLLFNVPPSITTLEQNASTSGLPTGSVQGTNGLGGLTYFGPCPPQGTTHRYQFKIYALSETLSLSSEALVSDFLTAINGKVLETGILMGNFR